MNFGILEENKVICRFNLRGMCRFGTRCRNIHESAEEVTERLAAGNKNEISDSNYALGACSLSPEQARNSQSRKASNKENRYGPSTSSAQEAINLVKKAESSEKSCGICFDMILQKVHKTDQTFGILPNCNHCFCFGCIRKWRQSKEFDLDVAKACPECRVASDFVYPSKYWVDNKEEKDEFIDAQKQRMKRIDCRYFRKGRGKCPFGNTCLYLHALPDGKILDVGPPLPRRRRPSGLDNELMQQILFMLNDDDLGEDADGEDNDFGLDLSDPCIAMQYYEHGDVRRYLAMERLMRGSDTDEDDSDYDWLL